MIVDINKNRMQISDDQIDCGTGELKLYYDNGLTIFVLRRCNENPEPRGRLKGYDSRSGNLIWTAEDIDLGTGPSPYVDFYYVPDFLGTKGLYARAWCGWYAKIDLETGKIIEKQHLPPRDW